MSDLQRFVDAQDAGGTHDRALRELRAFAQAAPDEPVFGEVLDRYFAGELDAVTIDRL